MIRYLLSYLLYIPFALGWCVGVFALICTILWLAIVDGYTRGRGPR